MAVCAGINAQGNRCKAKAMPGAEWCFNHSPDHEEARRRRASKGGKRGGRGRPLTEVADVKTRLSELADGVLLGTVDKADASVVSQVWNTYLRAVGMELKLREQEELQTRIEALE